MTSKNASLFVSVPGLPRARRAVPGALLVFSFVSVLQPLGASQGIPLEPLNDALGCPPAQSTPSCADDFLERRFGCPADMIAIQCAFYKANQALGCPDPAEGPPCVNLEIVEELTGLEVDLDPGDDFGFFMLEQRFLDLPTGGRVHLLCPVATANPCEALGAQFEGRPLALRFSPAGELVVYRALLTIRVPPSLPGGGVGVEGISVLVPGTH